MRHGTLYMYYASYTTSPCACISYNEQNYCHPQVAGASGRNCMFSAVLYPQIT